MTLKKRLRSTLLNVLTSQRLLHLRRRLAEWRRRLARQPHSLSIFVELDDPYSYLLCHYLPELQASYDVVIKLYLTEAVTGPLRPEPEMYAEYAPMDCQRLARELGIPFLDKGAAPPVEHRRALLGALAASEDSEDFAIDLIAAISAYWRGDLAAVARRIEGIAADDRAALMLERNQQRLLALGHYSAAMIHYSGEWYWGVDRLRYLQERLDDQGLRRDAAQIPQLASIAQVMQVNLPVRPPAAAKSLPPLELFVSFRSPYSYIVLQRVFDIVDAFGIELKLRPVMPMVARGMQVPRSKLLYIVFDAAREARFRDVPIGRVADPLGAGVERCQAVLQYAIREKRGREFLLNAGRAIWAEATDVATDAGLRSVAAATHLFWPEVLQSLGDESWREITNDNREAMMESGSWGVPTLRIGEFVTWGQDRDWLIVRHLEECCDSGEGILV